MLSPDLLNAVWEVSGGAFIATSVLQLYRDKIVRGVHWVHVSFFTAWGYWNLYYYPAIEQRWSFAGGVSVVAINTIWLAQLIYYSRKERSGRLGASNVTSFGPEGANSPADRARRSGGV